MLNYNTLIRKTAAAKEECYRLATDAYNNNDPDSQQKLYEISDNIQVALDKLAKKESEQRMAPIADEILPDLLS